LQRAKERGVRALIFSDDTFNVPADRFEAILDTMIREKIELPWYSFLRCQHVTEKLVDKMQESGCDGVFLGIESGSDRILKNMKKGAITRFYRNGIRWLKDRKITTVGAYVVGFPGETNETVAATQDFIETSGLDYYFIQPFFYLHHAPVHLRAKEFGLTGNGLFWSHKTMGWKTAVEHINRLFIEIKNATFINPDNTLWEYAYLRSKGFSADEFRDYRRLINARIAEQMTRFGIVGASPDGVMGITSRHEDIAVV
jgi:p-methyltransferase